MLTIKSSRNNPTSKSHTICLTLNKPGKWIGDHNISFGKNIKKRYDALLLDDSTTLNAFKETVKASAERLLMIDFKHAPAGKFYAAMNLQIPYSGKTMQIDAHNWEAVKRLLDDGTEIRIRVCWVPDGYQGPERKIKKWFLNCSEVLYQVACHRLEYRVSCNR